MRAGLTSAMQTEVSKPAVRMCYLVELRFDSGTEYHTTCYISISYAGNTYLGGNLVSVNGIREALPLEDRAVTIVLAGSQANLQRALTESYVGRTVVVYRALLDANEALIANPLQEFLGEIDRPAFQEDPAGDAALVWHVGAQFSRFEKVSGRRSSDDDQQLYFPGDAFFEFAAQVDDQIPWGRAS